MGILILKKNCSVNNEAIKVQSFEVEIINGEIFIKI